MSINLQGNAETEIFCDKIQLSEFVKTQPYGALLILDKSLRVLQCSENVQFILDVTVYEILNQPLSHFIKSDSNQDITTWLMQANNQYKKMYWQSKESKLEIFVYIHQTSEEIILEIERYLKDKNASLLDLTQVVISSINNTTPFQSAEELIQTTADEIKKITRYNRVIIYQFDTLSHSGKVLGEARDEDLDSYLGLRFPPFDIPKSVREMYLKLPMRYIPDIHADCVDIIPKRNPVSNNSLDLSFVNLRTVAPIHMKYMMNMGITSTVSIAIIKENTLWGLIICHHKAVKLLSLELRLILLLISNSLSCKLSTLESLINLKQEQKFSDLKITLSSAFEKSGSLSLSLESYHKDILQLVGATGMSVYDNRSVHHYGNTPTTEQIRELIAWLEKHNFINPYICSNLPIEYEASKVYKEIACGLLAIKMMQSQEKKYILFYKPEYIQTINWGGNPHETLKSGSSLYSPRSSFERFSEQMINTSMTWTNRQIKSAMFIQSIIIKKQLQDLLESKIQNEKLRMVTQLAAGFAHEINNPLSYAISNMQIFERRIHLLQQLVAYCNKLNDYINSPQSGKLEAICNEIFSFIQESNVSANISDLKNLVIESKEGLLRINEIINSLKSLSTDANENNQKIDINACISSAISFVKDETKSEFIIHQSFADLPLFCGYYNKLQIVFMIILKNMIDTFENKGEISISTSVINDDIVITFKDNDSSTKALDLENIFKPFYSHKSRGLVKDLNMSLAYTILKLHNGTICATSKSGVGAVYTVRLPFNIPDTNTIW